VSSRVSYVREKKLTIAGRSYGGYYQLVEGQREGGKVRQKVIAHLGKVPDIEAARRYADEHYSRTLEEVMRQFQEGHYKYNLEFGSGLCLRLMTLGLCEARLFLILHTGEQVLASERLAVKVEPHTWQVSS
jgi:hypothetical protein